MSPPLRWFRIVGFTLSLSAAETAATEDSETQSEDDDVSVSEDSESEDELLLEFGDASNSDENDSKDSESEEEDELPEGARVNRYGRKVGNGGGVILANRCVFVKDRGFVAQSSHKLVCQEEGVGHYKFYCFLGEGWEILHSCS